LNAYENQTSYFPEMGTFKIPLDSRQAGKGQSIKYTALASLCDRILMLFAFPCFLESLSLYFLASGFLRRNPYKVSLCQEKKALHGKY